MWGISLTADMTVSWWPRCTRLFRNGVISK